jgi:cytoskeletal protein CcmA (bactofilin family)
MAIWKDQNVPRKDESPAVVTEPVVRKENETRPEMPQTPTYTPPPQRAAVARDTRETRESLIAAELTIEGKIEGTGHVRIAGRFKGDVHVQGNLAIESGARLTGGVRAETVTIGGELEGNISEATRVELLESGVLNGDLKARSFIVAAGSRMRGQVEFGWDEKNPPKAALKMERGIDT